MGRIAVIAGPMSLPVLSEPPHASDVIDLARAIQLSLAPVFLLSAITALLGVISTRLARVIEPRPLRRIGAKMHTVDYAIDEQTAGRTRR